MAEKRGDLRELRGQIESLRKELVENQKLDGVVKLPSGVFRPYAGVSTAILFFTKTKCHKLDKLLACNLSDSCFMNQLCIKVICL